MIFIKFKTLAKYLIALSKTNNLFNHLSRL
jgi:hypothetical protein